MGKSLKIEPRTDRFIAEYQLLKDEGKMPSHLELAVILGVKSKSTISEILKKRQNIQPDSWIKFKKHFDIQEQNNTEISGQSIRNGIPGNNSQAPTLRELKMMEERIEEYKIRMLEIKEEKEARIKGLEKDKADYLRLLETNLTLIVENQSDLAALLRASVRRSAERFVKDDPKLTKKELDTISKYAEIAKRAGVPMGIHAHEGTGLQK